MVMGLGIKQINPASQTYETGEYLITTRQKQKNHFKSYCTLGLFYHKLIEYQYYIFYFFHHILVPFR